MDRFEASDWPVNRQSGRKTAVVGSQLSPHQIIPKEEYFPPKDSSSYCAVLGETQGLIWGVPGVLYWCSITPGWPV